MSVHLSDVEARVFGSLMEKELTTPDYYPLSLNALVNACNQKSNREPFVHYDDATVLAAIDLLRDKRLALRITGGDNRVPKYSHRAYETLNLGKREISLLCVLLLRGPQTAAELKERTGRMHEFDDMESVEGCLNRMATEEHGSLVKRIERQPGMREPRWAHLLCGEPAVVPEAGTVSHLHPEPLASRVERLETEIEELKARFAEFRKQFE